jgi:isopropylmalate/homocitrate/citramalate synthase
MSKDSGRPAAIIREVGPRDGLQMVKQIMPTSVKQHWIAAMVEAGVREMEVASFVPAALMPQMADAADLVAKTLEVHPSLRIVALVPNLQGARAAAVAGARTLLIPVSASEAHSLANVRKSTAEQIAAVGSVVDWAQSFCAPLTIEAAISTAFGCSLQGWVAERGVVSIAEALVRAGVDRIVLADTLGYATPSHIRRLVRSVKAEVGPAFLGNIHLHDTLGMGFANVSAALQEGVIGFDSALGGLGGCPFAPGSVGNINTEDLVYLLESEGFDTGIDLSALLQARELLRRVLPQEKLYGRVAAAGVPRTYKSARQISEGQMCLL